MEWVAPETSQPPVAPREPLRAPGAGGTGKRRERPGIPRLGPMTVSDVLDGAFDILKGAPGTILAFTAVFAVPVQLLGAWMQRDLLGGESFIDLINETDSSLQAVESSSPAGDLWTQMILLFGPSLALIFVAAGIVRLVGAWHVGQDLTLGELLRGSRRVAWPLLASWFLVHLAEGIGLLLCGFPALVAMTWFLVVAPVIGAEGLGPIEAMKRSYRLTTRRFWPVMGLAILSGIVSTLFGYALGLVPTTLSLFVGTDGLGWLITAAAGIITSLITLPIVAAATVLIYLDLRVRTEGLDLELDAREVLPA